MQDLASIPTFDDGKIRMVVETPRGLACKLSWDSRLGAFAYTRPLPLGLTYPHDWGFIPSTRGEDGDPLDGLCIHDAATAPGVVIACDLLGALRVSQTGREGGTLRNDRYILAPHRRGAENEQRTLTATMRGELEQFFAAAMLGTGKDLRFESWLDPDAAREAIVAGQKAFGRRSDE